MGQGRIIGAPNTPSVSAAPGVWSLREQYNAKKDDIWPITYFTLFDYPNFASTTGLELVSTSSIISNQIYLTGTAQNDVGNVYLSSSYLFNKNFFLSWNFECSGGTGADGFCIQWTKTNNTNGSAGGPVSRIESADTINALSFLTYSVGTPGLFWFKNNVQQGSVQANAISWRQNVFFWMDYDRFSQTASIYYNTTDSKPALANHTLTSFVFDSQEYYFGFGAATGGITDNHRLKSMKIIRET